MNLLVLYSMPINKDMTNKFGICPSTGHLSVLFPEKEAERTPSNKIFLAIVLQGGAMIEIDGKNHLIYTGTLIYLYPTIWSDKYPIQKICYLNIFGSSLNSSRIFLYY